MRRTPRAFRVLITSLVLATGNVAVFAQGPGGVPGMPMQRLGAARGPANSLGTPGMPMARMGRGGGIQQAAPARRNYGGMAGTPGIMSSQNFRANSYANQAKTSGMVRSSSGIVGGVTRGAASIASGSR